MKKSFDCVEMKDRLQEELRQEELRLGADEARRRRQHWLATDEAPLAMWWRSLRETVGDSGFPSAVREDAAPYPAQSGKEDVR